MPKILKSPVPAQFCLKETGLYLQFGEKEHRVLEAKQGEDFLAVIYEVEGFIDQETGKNVRRTLIFTEEVPE